MTLEQLEKMSISEALMACGYRHHRDERSSQDYCHSIYWEGEFLGRYCAKGMWELLCAQRFGLSQEETEARLLAAQSQVSEANGHSENGGSL